MAKSEEFQVLVKGPGLEVDRKVGGDVARAVVGLIFGTVSPHPQPPGVPLGQVRTPSTPIAEPLTATGTARVAAAAPELSVAEYLKQHDAERNVDKIASIAAYLKHQRQQETFTREDVVRMFEAAREKVPSNISRDITWTAKIGWIATSTQNENEFYLTRSGEEVVNKCFPDEVKQKTKIGGRPPGKAKGKRAK